MTAIGYTYKTSDEEATKLGPLRVSAWEGKAYEAYQSLLSASDKFVGLKNRLGDITYIWNRFEKVHIHLYTRQGPVLVFQPSWKDEALYVIDKPSLLEDDKESERQVAVIAAGNAWEDNKKVNKAATNKALLNANSMFKGMPEPGSFGGRRAHRRHRTHRKRSTCRKRK